MIEWIGGKRQLVAFQHVVPGLLGVLPGGIPGNVHLGDDAILFYPETASVGRKVPEQGSGLGFRRRRFSARGK